MLLCMTDLLGLILSTILVLLIELIESALEHLVDILRYINVYVLLLLLLLYHTISLFSVIAQTLKICFPYITANIPNTYTQHGYKTEHYTVTALRTY